MTSENSGKKVATSPPPVSTATKIVVPVLFFLAVLDKASSDYLDQIGHLELALTGTEVVGRFVVILISTAIFRVPLTMIAWNFALAPIAALRPIGYWRACGIVAAFHWIAWL